MTFDLDLWAKVVTFDLDLGVNVMTFDLDLESQGRDL